VLWLPLSDADGEHDWMDPVGGMTSIDNLRAAGNDRARMYVVPRAGHHGKLHFPLTLGASSDLVVITVYLDNAKAVNKLLLKELDE
jgi:cardiolipin-specific phospholipase